MDGVQWRGALRNWGDEISMGEMEKTSVQTFSNLFLKLLTEGFVTVVARTLEYLVGVSSKAATSGREKNKFGSLS